MHGPPAGGCRANNVTVYSRMFLLLLKNPHEFDQTYERFYPGQLEPGSIVYPVLDHLFLSVNGNEAKKKFVDVT